ncbi:unnamed protein product [Rotaria socialis]|uniref:AB hydrolase-1 domain-containing protein n=1 Tax=Rotaria socialis TaxID=392032 RepID=A0A819B875_9BILA|nr:unnamed protein product [Rotaria socialis]CAF3792327.1 unnamed protein product [Rotaria socialis]CAF4456586.1 unnamed protein product [Rotaria socialis]CAF4825103.1 unnamed protein product [Rotaria socialis]
MERSIGIKILVLIGKLVLSCFYGTVGAVLAALLFIQLGPRKFFRRVERPKLPAQATDPVHGQHDMIKLKSSGVSLHYVSKGSSDQPLMLFVHGFPECWYTWRYQMKYFSKNYRVVAIDQRGYGLSSKPSEVSNYAADKLARDIADIIEQLGYKSCVLVGHDWGAIISWTCAMLYPKLIDKLIILNVPHPAAFFDAISFRQLRRSWYIFFYQIPFIPELLFKSNDFQMLKTIFYTKPMGLVNQENVTEDDLEVFNYTFSQKGTPTAAINYYRALVRHTRYDLQKRIDVPVLIIWGCQDAALGEELADASTNYCSDVRLKKIRNASHWVQQDVPDEVNQYMEAFVNESSTMK